MAGLGDLFGKGSAAEQLFVWGVLNNVINALLQPALTELTYAANKTTQDVELAPAELATAVVRAYLDFGTGASSAANYGLDPDKFRTLVELAGESLGPDALAVALRRGLISESDRGADSTSFEQGIAESHLANKWADVVKSLAIEWPSPADALQALLEGQIDAGTAQDLYKKFGGDPDYFTMLFNTRGEAPTPTQALELANRGIIPWSGSGPDVVSYEQAFLEGPWRNKWLKSFEALGAYLPPPRTVTAMLKEGAIDKPTATSLLLKQGLTTDLVAAYVSGATKPKTATQKEVALADVLALYSDKIITETDATGMLASLGYDAQEAALVLKLQDVHRSAGAINTALSRVHSLYVGHKISHTTAAATITSLGVPADQVAAIIATWDLEAAVNIKTLSAAEIGSAFVYSIMTQDEAMQELQHLGFQPFDAWVLLSVHNKAPLPGKPAPDPANILGV